MEKPKKELPYYLRIDKQKNGIPVISMSIFRLTAFLQTVASIVVFGGVTYTLISFDVIYMSLYWYMLAICSGFFVTTMMTIIGLRELLLETKIILETDSLVKKTTWHKQIILEKDIASIRVEAPILQVLDSPFSSKMKTIQPKRLIIKLHNGLDVLLLDNFEDIQPAIHLRDFINSYYGLDEKPKTDYQSPTTNN